MIQPDRGMAELTGYESGDVTSAWKSLFSKDDVVGIKVNPVGRKPLPGEWGRNPNSVGSISSPALVVKVVECLRQIGLPAANVIVFEGRALAVFGGELFRTAARRARP